MKTKLTLPLLLAIALSGCSSPLTHVANQVFNFGQELPPDMVNTHISGMVAFDEEWTGNYNRSARNSLYAQGVVSGTPLYQFRIVRISLANTQGAFTVNAGELSFPTGAVVPDSMPRLMAEDIVEIRQTGTWRTMEKFVETGEGNVVVRILCRKSNPGYKECVAKAPSVGKAKGFGATGTPYPNSVAAYEHTFSQRYALDGKAKSPWPDMR